MRVIKLTCILYLRLTPPSLFLEQVFKRMIWSNLLNLPVLSGKHPVVSGSSGLGKVNDVRLDEGSSNSSSAIIGYTVACTSSSCFSFVSQARIPFPFCFRCFHSGQAKIVPHASLLVDRRPASPLSYASVHIYIYTHTYRYIRMYTCPKSPRL